MNKIVKITAYVPKYFTLPHANVTFLMNKIHKISTLYLIYRLATVCLIGHHRSKFFPRAQVSNQIDRLQ